MDKRWASKDQIPFRFKEEIVSRSFSCQKVRILAIQIKHTVY